MHNSAVVTGAGSGLGRACAIEFARRGLEVFCVGRRPGPLEETVQMIREDSGTATAIAADVGTQAGVDLVGSAVEGRHVVALVQSAARELVRGLEETSRDDFDAVMATNVAGPFFLTQRLMKTFEGGAGVVLISSMAAQVGADRHVAYGASKAALIGLTKHLAVELAPDVRVNCVCPGGMDTPMAREFLADFLGDPPSERAMDALRADAGRVLLRAIAAPEQVAQTVVHVALDATAMTGSVVNTDMGFTAR
jgi:3-oxoacyl-[acyl-carrier protein] reductase